MSCSITIRALVAEADLQGGVWVIGPHPLEKKDGLFCVINPDLGLSSYTYSYISFTPC